MDGGGGRPAQAASARADTEAIRMARIGPTGIGIAPIDKE
jgi:hypothetical protein